MKIIILLALVVSIWGLPAPSYRPMENPNLFEGDISGIESIEDRNAVARDTLIWPEAKVPYVIESDAQPIRNVIFSGMRHIEASTCIKFVPRTTETDYVKIFRGQGCYSNWGKGQGAQPLSLGENCDHFITAVHELMHAIGFEHEHNRSDRDDFVIINWHNVREEFFYAFYKLRPEQNRLLTPFDYDSIMLYGPTAFSKDDIAITIESKTNIPVTEMYDKPGLSADDIKRINILYRCQ